VSNIAPPTVDLFDPFSRAGTRREIAPRWDGTDLRWWQVLGYQGWGVRLFIGLIAGIAIAFVHSSLLSSVIATALVYAIATAMSIPDARFPARWEPPIEIGVEAGTRSEMSTLSWQLSGRSGQPTDRGVVVALGIIESHLRAAGVGTSYGAECDALGRGPAIALVNARAHRPMSTSSLASLVKAAEKLRFPSPITNPSQGR